MPASRFKTTVFPVGTRRKYWSRWSLLSGGILLGLYLGSGAPGYGFDSYQEFEKSKKQNRSLKIHALPDKDRVRPGGSFWLILVAELDKGWHMYSLEKQSADETVATRIELESMVFLPQGGWKETPPRLVHDDVMEKIMKTHLGRVEFSRLLQVPEDLKPGVYSISGTLRFRTCDNRICTLPQSLRFQTRVIVVAGEPG